MNLPDNLRNALTEELAGIPSKGVAEAVAQLSQRYRSSQTASQGTYVHSEADVVAYAAYRLPATFAAVSAALTAVQKRRWGWHPQTLLDVGAGPGTAMWAASELWPALEKMTLLERDGAMMALGKRLAAHARTETVRKVSWEKVDLLGTWQCQAHELVVMAYVLSELPIAQHVAFVQKLWSCTTDTLVLVEPGTPTGFRHIRGVREHLIEAGGQVAAPCPHSRQCPIPENDWCHFAQRLARTSLHRQVKQGQLAYEDEKFSYVAISRTKDLLQPIAGRIIRHPQIRPGHITLEFCTPEGLKSEVATRKNKEAFREARDVKWGDTFSAHEQE
jgi:ribosomal protein RSM22 (predicted rRNA methylase)